MDSFPDNFSKLTDDLLSVVVSKLGVDDSDLKSFRSVCKSFRRVEATQRRSLRVLRTEFIPSLLKQYERIDSLDLSVCPLIDDCTVAAVASCVEVGWTRKLSRLVLSRSSGLGPGGLERLMRLCGRLESVDVSYCCGFGDREAAAISGAVGLREVRMDKCLKVSDVGLAKVAVGCDKLERLSVKWCLEISDLGLDFLAKKCVNLKHLDISYLKVYSICLYFMLFYEFA